MTTHTTTPVLRVGIVGCGNIADNHFRSLTALPQVEIVGVADVDEARSRSFAEDRGIPGAVTSVGRLLELGVHAVTVCTPHPTHEDVVTAAARAGVHVLCEKPLAVDVAAAQRMVAAAEQHQIILGTVFQRRFWPAAKNIRAAIDDGLLGIPMLGHCQVLLHRGTDYYDSTAWRGTWAADGGGVLMTQAIHYIDLLQWFMGEPVEVSAKAGAFVRSDVIEVEDTAAAIVTFSSGAIATLSATVTAAPSLGARITITGNRGGTVSLAEYPEGSDAVNDVWTLPPNPRATSVYTSGIAAEIPVADVNAALLPLHRQQLADFVDAVRTGRPPAVSGRQAMNSLLIVQAVYESARTGQPVRLRSEPSDVAFHHLAAPALVA